MIRKLIPNMAVNLLKHLPTAVIANLIYGFPSEGMKFIGVTGTDGKTTTVNMIHKILKDAGFKVSMVSTINAEIAGEKIDTGFHVTSPDSLPLQKLIKQAKDKGTEIFVLEITSHGLDQFRTWGIDFEVGVITNITHEHLDYHQSFEKYFNAKARLIKNSKTAVLNSDEENYKRLLRLSSGNVLSFGLGKKAQFNPKRADFKLKIGGDYNKLNALAAIATVSIFGVDAKNAIKSLENFEDLEGRMEEIENKLGIRIIIDFAHTPNALENALESLRKQTTGKLVSVFGCAGMRDAVKRPLMGEVSARLADITIITAEDPRGEISEINEEIIIGAQKTGGVLGKNIFIENDRQKAINLAIRDFAKKGDTIGIFGKGHEKSMNLDGKNEIPWSDREAVLKVLNEGKN